MEAVGPMNNKRLATFALAFCLLAPQVQAAPDPTVRNSVAVCDPNAAQHCEAPYYASAVSLTVGGANLRTATKGIAADCTEQGTATLTMSDGSTLQWSVMGGHQNQPYSVLGVPSSTATCNFYGLN